MASIPLYRVPRVHPVATPVAASAHPSCASASASASASAITARITAPFATDARVASFRCRRSSAAASSASCAAAGAPAGVRCGGSTAGASGVGCSRTQSGNAATLAGRCTPQMHRSRRLSLPPLIIKTSPTPPRGCGVSSSLGVAGQTCTFEIQARVAREYRRPPQIALPGRLLPSSPAPPPAAASLSRGLRVVCSSSASGARSAVTYSSRATVSPSPVPSARLSLTTFNILAPIYKRLGCEGERESAHEHVWRERNGRIVQLLQSLRSSIVCLQEFWFDGSHLEALYDHHLSAAGYTLYKLPRTNDRGDGLLTAVRTSAGGGEAENGGDATVRVVDYEPILFRDCGDRVAQLLRVRAAEGEGEGEGQAEGSDSLEGGQEMIVVNTHLLFPHNANSSVIRLREVYKILEYLESYKQKHQLGALPILLAGDLNGPKDGEVCRFLRSQGFVSCYDSAQGYDDTHTPWVSHRNHRGEDVGVDFIWLLNPAQQQQPLTADWKAVVFHMIRAKLLEAGITDERQAFEFFHSAGEHETASDGTMQQRTSQQQWPHSHAELQQQQQQWQQRQKDGQRQCERITPDEFAFAMDKLGLTGEQSVGLTRPEIEQLVQRADVNGCGAIDYEEFALLLRSHSLQDTFHHICKATGIREQPWQETLPRQAQEPAAPPAAAAAGAAAAAAAGLLRDLQQSLVGTSSSFSMSLGRHGPMVFAASAVAAASASISAPASAAASASSAAAAAVPIATQQERDEECLDCDCARTDCEGCGYSPDRRDRRDCQQQQQQDLKNGFGTRELAVEAAELFPPQMQHGTWPEDYELSDHAAVTAVLRLL